MANLQPWAVLSILPATLVGCSAPIIRLNSAKEQPNQLPRSWLKAKTTPEAVVATRLRSMDPDRARRWADFTSGLQSGGELWFWQSDPESYGTFYWGYCIIKDGKIISLIHIATGAVLD